MAQAPAAPQISAAPQPSPPAQTAPSAARRCGRAATPRRRRARPAPAARGTAQRAAPVAPASAPSGEGEYKVQAKATRCTASPRATSAPSVSLDQMLVALFRNNPNAFIGDNMNRLKAGAVLTCRRPSRPTRSPPPSAQEIIRAQSADFGAYRQRLAGNVPTTPADEQLAPGHRQGAGSDRRPQAGRRADPDKLTLSQGAVKPGAGSTEAKASKDAEKKDAASRVAELTRNVEELKKLQEGAAAAKTATAPRSRLRPRAGRAAAPPPAPATPAPTPAPARRAAPAPPVAQAPAPSRRRPSPRRRPCRSRRRRPARRRARRTAAAHRPRAEAAPRRRRPKSRACWPR